MNERLFYHQSYTSELNFYVHLSGERKITEGSSNKVTYILIADQLHVICLSLALSIKWNLIRLGGPTHGIVTKTVYKIMPGDVGF